MDIHVVYNYRSLNWFITSSIALNIRGPSTAAQMVWGAVHCNTIVVDGLGWLQFPRGAKGTVYRCCRCSKGGIYGEDHPQVLRGLRYITSLVAKFPHSATAWWNECGYYIDLNNV